MLSQSQRWKRSLQPGVRLFAGLCLLFLAAVPASAQLDPGTRGWGLVTGHWSKGAPDSAAWVDLTTWKLVTQFKGPVAIADPDPSPWMPVAGNWDGSGVQTVKMFDPHTWSLVDLVKGPLTGSNEPEPQPWVPVAGDWDGRGYDTVLVVDLRDQSVHKLEEGPIPVKGYDPDPSPWRPVAGKWDGGRVATIAFVQVDGAASTWRAVAGDWTGSGIDTVAAMHSSGTLVQAVTTTQTRTPAGCYTEIKNATDLVKVFYGIDGGVTVVHFKTHEEWTCCPIALLNQYICSMRLVVG